MFLKYLVWIGAASGIAGTATAITLFNSSVKKEIKEESSEKNKNISIKNEDQPLLKNIPKEKTEFKSVLVFSRELYSSGPGSKKGNVFYQAELLSEEEYKQKEGKWKKEDHDDEYDPSSRVKIDVSSEKTKKDISELKKYLEELNKKIESSNDLDKLRRLLEKDQEKFKENFGANYYDGLLQKIKSPSSK